jgi:AraC-like DNA-binding protein
MVELPAPVTRDWAFPRSAAGIAVLLDQGAASGLDATRLLRGTGLGPADVTDADRLVTAEQELRVVRNLVGARPDLRGADVGQRYHVSSFGIAGYALLSSPTLRAAMEFALRYLDLTFTFVIPHAAVRDGQVEIRVADDDLPPDVRRFLRERDMVAIDTVLGELVDGALPTRVDLDAGVLSFPSRQLDRPLAQANPATRALCESLCADLASRRREAGGTAQQVRVLLAQRLAYDARMAGVADGLGLSERTLRRRLADEGVAFQQLLDELRAALAERLLATGSLTVDEVALRLGYAEASSFIHAHKRWFGRTPGARA